MTWMNPGKKLILIKLDLRLKWTRSGLFREAELERALSPRMAESTPWLQAM